MIESDCYTQVNGDLPDWIANRAPNAALRKMALLAVKHSTPEQWGQYYWWESMSLDADTCLEMSQTLRNINADFPIKKIGVIRIASNTQYPPHKDLERGCGINMLLSDCNLHATESFTAWIKENKETCQLRYEQDTMYLINTRIEHTVFNFNSGSSGRLMFTVELETTNIDHRDYFPDYAEVKQSLEQS